jgi:CheY-like chemotaxis protein
VESFKLNDGSFRAVATKGGPLRKRILLVDDTLTVLTLEQVLLGAEFEFVTAKNGADAIKTALARKPDLILMDINMPVMDGVESLRQLKSDDATKHIPVVMVTTRGEAVNQARCRELGCDAFLTKPLERDRLQETVRLILNR